MEPATCDIERLPEELLVYVISLTSPADAFRAAAVSRAFHTAAGSDTVWSRFLPRDLPRFAKKELPRTPPPTKKGLFLRLADQPALLPGKFIRMQLDKATGAKCFALSASMLQFPRDRWRWHLVHLGFSTTRGKRFSQAAKCSLAMRAIEFEICGKIHRRMLSRYSTYAAYLVFKIERYEFCGRDVQFEEASVTVGGRQSTRRVCLAGYSEDGDHATADDQVPSRRHVLLKSTWETQPRAFSDLGEDVAVSQKRADGWMEAELGEFCNEGDDDDGDVSMSLTETYPGTLK